MYGDLLETAFTLFACDPMTGCCFNAATQSHLEEALIFSNPSTKALTCKKLIRVVCYVSSAPN